MYLRLLLVAAAVWLVFLAVRALRGKAGRRSGRERALPEAEPMVRCERCGTFVPASRAVRAGDRSYCSEAHARGDAGDPPGA